MGTGTWVAIATPLSGFILGVLGFLGTVATILASRRQDKATATKTSAEALQVVQETTLNLLDPMQKQIDQLRAENTYLVADVKQLKDRVEVVEEDREILVEAISAHVEWEDSGRLDPPGAPRIAPKVRSILARVHAA